MAGALLIGVTTVSTLVIAGTAGAGGTGPGASGNTIPGAAAAQAPFTAGTTFDSGQPIDVVVPPNSVLTPAQKIFVLECAAPGGVVPLTINSCDGNTAYAGGTITVNADGSIDVINSSTNSGIPYTIYALPDVLSLGESPSGTPKCGMGSANECVLYIGQGGGSDTGLSQPHFFSQPFQVHPDPIDSGTLNPGDGAFPADAAPAITSASSATFAKGSAGTFSVTATGWAPPTFTETGALPAGVTLKTVANGETTTGALSGTPAQSGSFPITVTASNGVGSDATQSFTLTVSSPSTGPTITSANSATFKVGTAGTFTVTASGNPAPTFAETGVLPTGVTLNATTGVLSGTPAAGTGGIYPITITATNGTLPDATQAFTLTVDQAPAITSGATATFTVGTAGTFTVTASGNPAPTFAETGTLPSGVTLNSATGVLSGTPAAATGGTYPITITAANGTLPNATQAFTLTVDQAPAITSGATATFTVGSAGTFTVTSTGFPAPTYAETGALPGGVTLNASTGVLSGTPAAATGGTYPITITATNGTLPNATQAFTLTVDQAPAITSGASTTFTVGSAGTFTVTSTGFPAATYAETGALPGGVTLNASTGVLSGTPIIGSTGSYPITFTAANGTLPNATQAFTLTVNTLPVAPTITSASSTTFKVGTAGTFTVTASGNPAPTVAETGALPGGVTLNSATGVLSGTPAAATGGTYPITITAANGTLPNATQAFTLTVDQAPAITSGATATFTVGSAGTFTVTSTGFPAPTYAETGALPGGVTLNASTGVLSGTPAAGTGGTYPITITAANGTLPNATQAFTLTVTALSSPPTITSATSTTFKVGTAGTFTVTASGNPAPTVAETGTLPSGVTLNSATGVLSGTPAAATGGTYPITITATNGTLPNATQAFTLTVDQAPAITSGATATFTVGSAGTFTVTSTGFPAATYAETGALPGGVTLNASTGVLSGTPIIGSTGSYPITFTAANGTLPNATQAFTLTVNTLPVAPTITSASSTTFKVGTAGTFTVTASGNPAPTVAETGALPGGVTLNSATGVLSGTPAAATGGTYPITITAANGTLPNATQAFTLTVDQAPAITSGATATFTVGSAGTFTVTSTGFPAPTYAETGALPGGVTLNASTGVLSGTPAAGTGGTYPITITATNGTLPNATHAFTLTVDQAPAITSAGTTAFIEGSMGTFRVTATGYPSPTFTETGALPTGVALTAAGLLSGAPTQSGSFPTTITATNGIGTSATQSFTLTVALPPLAVSTVTLPGGIIGSAYSQSLAATGGQGAVTWSVSTGTLPGGISLDATTGVLSGTPTAVGTFDFTATATDAASATATAALSIVVTQPTTTPPVLSGLVVGFASTPGGGYWLVDASGDVVPHGDAVDYGSLAGTRLVAPVVDIAATADGKGYWLVAGDGGVFAYGDAAFAGSLGATHINAPVVSLTVTADGKGYWLVAGDGGVFAYGDAAFAGSLGATHINAPVVSLTVTADGMGYWLVAGDGGVFAFGDAAFDGSMGNVRLNAPVVGVAGTTDGKGYWLVAADGGVFAFGDAAFFGAATTIPNHGTITGISANPAVGGYQLFNDSGSLYAFGPTSG